MPVLVGFCATIPAVASSASRDNEATLFLAALRRLAPDRAKHEAAVARFAQWAAEWLARERVTDPVLYPLPSAHGADGLFALAEDVARYIGPAATVRAILEPARKADRLGPADGLILSGADGDGAPILFGDVYDPDLLRASALKLNEAGAKPMHALYAARIGDPPSSDAFDVRNESFSVR